MEKQDKVNVIDAFKRHPKDTGSAEVQVAILSARVAQLTAHMAANKQDAHTKRNLLRLVGQRRRMLAYLRREDATRYQDLIVKIGLRK